MMKKLFFFWLLVVLGTAVSAQTIVTPATGAVFTTTGTITSGTVSATVTSGTVTITATPSVGYYGTATFNRPQNTTTYSAVDVIGGSPTAVITLSLVDRSGTAPATGSGLMLTSCDLLINATAVPSGMGNMKMELYRSSPASNYADNAAWDLPSGDQAAYIGSVDFGTPVDKGSTLFAQVDSINKHVQLAAGSTAIYAYLVTTGSFAPAANSETYKVTCRAVGL